MSDPYSQQLIAQQFLASQQAQQAQQAQQSQASLSVPQAPVQETPINIRPSDLNAILDTVASKAHQATLGAVQNTQQLQHNSNLLPKHILTQTKPRQYENREKSGIFKVWAREIRNYCRLQGLDPDTNLNHNFLCKQVVELNCIGEAQSYLQRLPYYAPAISTFDGILEALAARFTHPEEARNARRALDNLKMTGTMTARDYCNRFERLLDEAPPMSEDDVLYSFHKGLPQWLQQWLNYEEPKTLHNAINLVCKMAGQLQQPSAQPMEIGKMGRGTPAGLRTMPSARPAEIKRRLPPHIDPRKHPRWPPWKKATEMELLGCMDRRACFICHKTGHHWTTCNLLRPSNPPSLKPSQPNRSPSPTWAPRPSSPKS